MKVGTLVQYWHDTGAMGSVPVFGVVVQETPKTFVVTWEYNRTTRVRKERPNGVRPVAAYNLVTARELLAKHGVTQLPSATPDNQS